MMWLWKRFLGRSKGTNVCKCGAAMPGCWGKRSQLRAPCLLHLICNFGHMLRISIYGRSDLLSYLYAASRAQVTFGPK